MDPEPGSIFLILDFLGGFNQPIWESFLIVTLLLVSAVMSGSEVALFSLKKDEIAGFRTGKSFIDKSIADLVSRPRYLLSTILIVNNLANVSIVIIASLIMYEYSVENKFPPVLVTILEVGVITFVLVFFGEITPKIYASQRRMAIVGKVAVPLRILRTVFYPVSWVLIKSTSFIDKRISVESEAASAQDLKHAIDLTSEEESPEEEKVILKGIVNFGNTACKSIMTSRVDVDAIDFHAPLPEILPLINKFGWSRIPVFEANIDQIRGILYIKDLLPLLKENQKVAKKWQDLIRGAYYVPESKKIDDLLDEFKRMRLHIAVVVDEFGGTAGIVTLEDIIEEIFGEINDEFDTEDLVYSRLSESEFIFDGKIPLNDLLKIANLPENVFDAFKGEADSLAGMLLEVHGKIPESGDLLEINNFRFRIEAVGPNRIKRVKFAIVEQPKEFSS